MKKLLPLLLCAVFAEANAAKPCDELKSEIDAKIKANGVPEFSLEIIDAATESEAQGKIVGSCDGGTKRIVYRRGSAAATPVAPQAGQPAAANG